MILSRNKKTNVYPCKPQFYCIKVGFKGVKTIQSCFRDEFENRISLKQVLRGVGSIAYYITVHEQVPRL